MRERRYLEEEETAKYPWGPIEFTLSQGIHRMNFSYQNPWETRFITLGTFNSITLVVLLYLAVICFLVTMRTNRTDIGKCLRPPFTWTVELGWVLDIRTEKSLCQGTLDSKDFTNIILYIHVMVNPLSKITSPLLFIAFASVRLYFHFIHLRVQFPQLHSLSSDILDERLDIWSCHC